MIETIVISLLSVLLLLVIIDDIRIRIHRRSLADSLITVTLDNFTLQDELASSNNIPSDTEGFIKFLSDSRESAYEYIEDIQALILKLDDAVKNGDEQGILKVYVELMTYLPDNKTNN